MNVLEVFDHAFVINLPADTSRLIETSSELARCNISFERFEGILPSVALKGKAKGRLGCLLSHLSAVKEAQRREYQSVLIIEDDVVLRPQFCELWADVMPQLASLKYDLFYFYRWGEIAPLLRPVRVVEIEGTLCGHFYVVNACFYNSYIAIAEAQLRAISVVAIDRLFRNPSVKIFATSYNLVGQRAGKSNISKRPRPNTIFNQIRGACMKIQRRSAL